GEGAPPLQRHAPAGTPPAPASPRDTDTGQAGDRSGPVDQLAPELLPAVLREDGSENGSAGALPGSEAEGRGSPAVPDVAPASAGGGDHLLRHRRGGHRRGPEERRPPLPEEHREILLQP